MKLCRGKHVGVIVSDTCREVEKKKKKLANDELFI